MMFKAISVLSISIKDYANYFKFLLIVLLLPVFHFPLASFWVILFYCFAFSDNLLFQLLLCYF